MTEEEKGKVLNTAGIEKTDHLLHQPFRVQFLHLQQARVDEIVDLKYD